MNRETTHTSLKRHPKLDEKQFEKLFFEYYTPLCQLSLRFVKVPEIAEEIVQDIYTYLWEKRNILEIHVSYKSYLFTSTRNKSIDYLRSKYSKTESVKEEEAFSKDTSLNPALITEGKELENILSQSLQSLPKGCYEIFALSRFGGLTNKQIATHLDISIKTVEYQMTKALKRIKSYVEKYWEPIS